MECHCNECVEDRYMLSLHERLVNAVECIAFAAGLGLVVYGLKGLTDGE